MKKPLKTVIDTNVFISILLGSKNCLKIREHFLNDFFDIVISSAMVNELIDTINLPKFKNIFIEKDIRELIELLQTDTELVTTKENIKACRDPKDNIVLECALAGKADFIVTGDNDLLSIKTFRGIVILTPQQFLTCLK
jgi:hypothetical protein